jgi:hypothetical protein
MREKLSESFQNYQKCFGELWQVLWSYQICSRIQIVPMNFIGEIGHSDFIGNLQRSANLEDGRKAKTLMVVVWVLVAVSTRKAN